MASWTFNDLEGHILCYQKLMSTQKKSFKKKLVIENVS